MLHTLNFDEIYKRIYPPDVRITNINDINQIQRLYRHCEDTVLLIEDMEALVCMGSPYRSSAERYIIHKLHANLLNVAADILRQPHVVVSGFALRIAAAVINRGCSDPNTLTAMKIFSDFDKIVSSNLGGYRSAYRAAQNDNKSFELKKVSGATIKPTTEAISLQQEEYEVEATAVKILALASIHLGTRVTASLQERAVECLCAMGRERMTLYQKVIIGCVNSLCDEIKFPSGMNIFHTSYRRIHNFVVTQAAQLKEEEDQEKKQIMIYDIIGFDTDILLNCHHVPSLVTMSRGFCKIHWTILKSIHLEEAQDFLSSIQRACKDKFQNPDSREGAHSVLDLTRELLGKGSYAEVLPNPNTARKSIINLTSWVPHPSLAQ